MASCCFKNITWRTLTGLAIVTAFPVQSFAQTSVSCAANLAVYVANRTSNAHWEGTDVIMTRGGVDYVCRCPSPSASQVPVCKPRESSGSGSGGGGGVDMSRFSPGQRFALSGIQALLNGIFSDPPKASSPPREDPAVAAAEILRRQQEELKRQEDARLQLLEDWKLFQKAEKARLMAEKENSAAKLSDKTMGTGGGQGLAYQPVSGGDLGFAGLSYAEMAKKPIGPAKPTAAAAQARCAASFSDKAIEFNRSGNTADARFYNLQAQKAMIGEPTDVPCEAAPTAADNVPAVPAGAIVPDPAIDAVIEQYGVKIQELLDISQKLTEARQQKVKAAHEVKDTEARILDLKGRTATATDPGEKQQVDDLLAQALALKSESEARLKDAEAAEQSCLTDVRKTEDQVKELNAKLPAKKDSK